jgi:ribosomal protein L29
MVDEPTVTDHGDAADLDVLRLTDEVIGLSAELAELRIQVDLAAQRAISAAEVAQHAEVAAQAATEQTQSFEEYLAEMTTGFGARQPVASESASSDLSDLSKAELIARVESLEAVLGRRSMQVALGLTKKLRGS